MIGPAARHQLPVRLDDMFNTVVASGMKHLAPSIRACETRSSWRWQGAGWVLCSGK